MINSTQFPSISSRRLLWCAVSAAVLLLAGTEKLWAFDPSTHQAIVETVAQGYKPANGRAWRVGVGKKAVRLLVRYSTIGDDVPDANGRCGTHFDNCCWDEGQAWIIDNREAAVILARSYHRSHNPQDLDLVFQHLGYVVHATEDFYAHSNWIETHWAGTLVDFDGERPNGWFSGTFNDPLSGPAECPAGTPTHDQLNKDSEDRVGFDEAYWDAVDAVYDQVVRFHTALIDRFPAQADKIWDELGFNVSSVLSPARRKAPKRR